VKSCQQCGVILEYPTRLPTKSSATKGLKFASKICVYFCKSILSVNFSTSCYHQTENKTDFQFLESLPETVALNQKWSQTVKLCDRNSCLVVRAVFNCCDSFRYNMTQFWPHLMSGPFTAAKIGVSSGDEITTVNLRWNYAEIRAITPFNVTSHIRLPINNQY